MTASDVSVGAAALRSYIRREAVSSAGPDECWEWPGMRDAKGYGRVYNRTGIGAKNAAAHRIAYELHVGAITEGMVIDHLCRNRGCINPRHMEVVSNAVNVRRGVGISAENARKTHCKYGHPLQDPNLYISKSGSRVCRECLRRLTREGQKRRRERLKAVAS